MLKYKLIKMLKLKSDKILKLKYDKIYQIIFLVKKKKKSSKYVLNKI